MNQKIKLWLVAFIITLSLNISYSQNPFYQQGMSFKALFMDYQSQNGGNISEFKAYHHGLEIGYHHNLQSNINLVVPVKIGVVSSDNIEIRDAFHRTVYGLDAQVQYMQYKPNSKLIPYAMSGIGGVYEDGGDFNLQIPFGIGFMFQAAENAYINWQSEYRLSFADDRNNLHHGIGFVYLINKRDELPKELEDIDEILVQEEVDLDDDNDGIINELDLCPQAAGPKELNGCPDKDGDGIADYKDACPGTAGLKAFGGCPDTDGDGIADNEDECPNMPGKLARKGCPDNDDDSDGVPNDIDECPSFAGPASNNGCPEKSQPVVTNPSIVDTDGDGLEDSIDRCPNAAGPATSLGCPDTDGDGIIDSDDKCPNSKGISAYAGCPDTDGDGLHDGIDSCPRESGSVANSGCPEIAREDLDILELAMRAVQFDTGKSTLKSESYRVLNQIGDIMARYPNFKLSIDGHTDNTGNADNNQKLSERRAQACYEYLIKKGVPAGQVRFQGFGEARPISSNETLRGRALNRRVEFNLSPR